MHMHLRIYNSFIPIVAIHLTASTSLHFNIFKDGLLPALPAINSAFIEPTSMFAKKTENAKQETSTTAKAFLYLLFSPTFYIPQRPFFAFHFRSVFSYLEFGTRDHIRQVGTAPVLLNSLGHDGNLNTRRLEVANSLCPRTWIEILTKSHAEI